MDTPAAEVVIDEVLVRSLLTEQHPDLAHLELKYLNEGWDNTIYRLGNDYLMRIPRRSIAVPLIEREQSWLTSLAPQLPIATPVPVRIGQPQSNYPWPWSITPWFNGKTVAEQRLHIEEAERLSQFLRVLHDHPVPTKAPHNPHRSSPLVTKNDGTQKRIRQYMQAGLVRPKIATFWAQAIDLDCPTQMKCLIHGDLHPKNIVAQDGKITAIIDWGDFALGDPATDLAIFWMVFSDDDTRKKALQMYGAQAPLIRRSIGWAIFFGTILLDVGLSGDKLFHKVGTQTLANIEATEWP